MDQYRKKYFLFLDYTVLIVTVVISFVLIFAGNDEEQTMGIQSVAMEILGVAVQPVHTVQRLLKVRNENSRLLQKNSELLLRMSQYEEAFHENQRLRSLIGFEQQEGFRGIPANVIAFRKSTGVQTILVNAGLKRGVTANSTVVSGDGLVGKIIKVSDNRSTVQLLSDHNFRAAARIQRTREAGIYYAIDNVQGNLNGIARRSNVEIGDKIITTGMESIYPAGLLVGIVTKIEKDIPGLFLEINVKAGVEFKKLEEVFIILK